MEEMSHFRDKYCRKRYRWSDIDTTLLRGNNRIYKYILIDEDSRRYLSKLPYNSVASGEAKNGSELIVLFA